MGRLKLKNRPLAKRPGGGTLQHVYMMNGCELCAVEAAAQPEEVRETVLRMLNLRGPLTAVVQLIRLGSQSYMGNAGDWQVMIHPTLMHKNEGYIADPGICDVCSGVFGTEAGFLLDDFEACTLCYPTGCCSKCSHIWQTPQGLDMYNGEVTPGTHICALCMTPDMLNTEAEHTTYHFRFVAMAWMSAEESYGSEAQ